MWPRLILFTNRKSHKPFQMTLKSSTLDDLEGSLHALQCHRDADSRYLYELVTTRYCGSRYSLLSTRYSNRYWVPLFGSYCSETCCSAASLTPPTRLAPALVVTAWHASPRVLTHESSNESAVTNKD